MRLLTRAFKKWSGNRKYFMLFKLYMYKPLHDFPENEAVESIQLKCTVTTVPRQAFKQRLIR